jgi:hypothetical protein
MICWKVKKLMARQEDVELGRAQSGDGGRIADQEVRVFEPAQQRQVEDHATDQPVVRGARSVRLRQPQDALPDRVVDQDRTHQQQHECRVPPAVEEQAGDHQPAQCPT